MSNLYTCAEIAKIYRVQTETVWDWIRKKKLLAIKIGKEYRISEESLEQFQKERLTIQK